MYTLLKIEQQLDATKSALERHEAALTNAPDSFFIEMMINDARYRIEDLTKQLIDEKTSRENEIVELRLIGKQAKGGTLPLDILGKLSLAFAESILNVSMQIQYGSKRSNSRILEMKRTLDVRFAGVASGSTRLFLTGLTNPDLFGRSLMEESLEKTFGILQSDSAEGLMELSSGYGFTGLKSLNGFLNVMDDNDLEVDISWDSPKAVTKRWVGQTQNIKALSNTLGRIENTVPVSFPFEGVLIASSLKGGFEIKDQYKKTYRGNYPTAILGKVKEIVIGDDCKGIIEESKIKNIVSGTEKSSYTLLEIERTNS